MQGENTSPSDSNRFYQTPVNPAASTKQLRGKSAANSWLTVQHLVQIGDNGYVIIALHCNIRILVVD